jgi:hypothetical protein
MDYDGMLSVELTLDPQGKPVKLDRLGLVMDLAGLVNVCKAFRGSSYAGGGGGLIPADQKGVIWDSAATRPIPGLAGTFNPAIYVGNPDRGIWWFADSDQGWILDDAKSASTVERLADGHIRVNQWLVNRPATLDKPRTISFLLQAAPAKPLPQGWREVAWGPQRIWGASWADGYYTFSFDTPELWREFSKWDWASRGLYVATNLIGPAVPGFEVYAGEWTGNSDLRGMTVNHDVEKYFPDKVYKNAAGQKFSEDFRRRVSNYIGVDTVRSLVDCRTYYFDQGVKYGKLRGFWWDMDTIWPAFKPDLGFGYTRDDGTRQPGFNYRALREMFKRLYQVSYMNGSDSEHWHYADGYYGSFLYGAWLTEGFFYMFSEDVDLISGSSKDWWPLVAGRHIASIPQLRSNFYELKLDRPFANPAPTRAGMTVCLLNDMGGYEFNDSYRNAILAALRKDGFFDPAVTSVRHWEPEAAQSATYAAEKKAADVLVTLYLLPGRKLLVVLGNMSETATHGTLTLRPATLLPGIDNFQHWKLRDVENGVKPYMGQQHPDEIVFERVGVGGHDFRLLILEQ